MNVSESIVASLLCKDLTLLSSHGEQSRFPSAVRIGLAEALSTIHDEEAAIALDQPEHSKANFDNLLLERLRNRLPTGFSIERKTHVSVDTRHENDFAISGPDSAISVEIEKGDRARFDLDIRKMEAFAKGSPKSAFGVFIVPLNNRVDRSISGNTRESSFDYVCRTLRLSAHISIKPSLPLVTIRDRIGEALDLLKKGLEPFIDREMQQVHGKDWEKLNRKSEYSRRPQATGDVSALLKVLADHWNDVFKSVLDQVIRSITYELIDVRNRWAHQEAFSLDDTYRALDSAERLLRAVNAVAQTNELKRQRDQLRVELSRETRKGNLIDVLIIGYRDPRCQNQKSTQVTPTRRPARDTAGMHQNTERLTFQNLVELFGGPKGDPVERSSAFQRLREILLQRVPGLKEKLNPKGKYVGYRAVSSDRAYVYVQPSLLIIDVKRPRAIEPSLRNIGIEIIHRNNFQGKHGWTTGIRLSHNAPSSQGEIVADQIIKALTD